MELHQIQYVVAVYKHKNYTKAAAELCVTQPTLSHQIIKLEGELGVSLFERNTRSVKATEEGEEFFKHCKVILEELEKIEMTLKKFRSFHKGNIKLGIISETDPNTLMPYVYTFHNEHPNIHVQIIERPGSNELYQELLEGIIDMAFLIPEPSQKNNDSLVLNELVNGRVHVMLPAEHRFANLGSLHLGQLKDESFILPQKTFSMYGTLINEFRNSGFEPNVVSDCNSLRMMIDMTLNGYGVSFISSQNLSKLFGTSIKAVLIDPLIERSTYVAVLKSRIDHPIISAFLCYILKQFEKPEQK